MTDNGNGTQFNPYTRKPESGEWGDMWCKCGKCGVIGLSTLAFDFYEMAGDEGGLFHCEDCMMSHKNWKRA